MLASTPAVAAAQDSPIFGEQVTYKWAAGSQYTAFAGDFNGDGVMDIGLRHSIDGIFFIKHGPSFTDQVSYQWAAGTQYQPFAADFNGDGKADIGLRHTLDGVMFWKSGPSFNDQSSFTWASGDAYQPFAADFDGDGRADLGLRSVPDGTFFIRIAPAFTQQRVLQWAGGAQYQAFAADFDGDHLAEAGLRHSIDGIFFMRPGPSFGGQFSYPWSAGDQYQAFAGDANGDGRADIGLRLVTDGTFSVLKQLPKTPEPTPGPVATATAGPVVATDADGDRVSPPLDCDDGNASIRPGGVDTPGDRVDQDCSGADAPYPVLKARANFSWAFKGARTLLTKVTLSGLTGAESARVACQGAGCPFAAKTYRNLAAGNRTLTSIFRKRQLRSGVRIEVRITAPAAVGSSATVTIRKRRQDPKITRLCVVPGASAAAKCA